MDKTILENELEESVVLQDKALMMDELEVCMTPRDPVAMFQDPEILNMSRNSLVSRGSLMSRDFNQRSFMVEDGGSLVAFWWKSGGSLVEFGYEAN